MSREICFPMGDKLAFFLKYSFNQIADNVAPDDITATMISTQCIFSPMY